jgi:hypothetical protein
MACDHHFSLEVRMSDSKDDQKRALECLRLASDLIQLAAATPNPDLKAHCVRMAGLWTDLAEHAPIRDVPLRRAAYH